MPIIEDQDIYALQRSERRGPFAGLVWGAIISISVWLVVGFLIVVR